MSVLTYMQNIGLWIASGFLALSAGFLGVFHLPPVFSNSSPVDGIACTADAKLCPDGSYVGRSGPNCEFVCPSATSTASVPQTVVESGSIVCLPFKGGGIHIMICKYGLKADNDLYYGLVNAFDNNLSYEVGDRIQVKGALTPSSADETYNIAGTIDVTSTTRLESDTQSVEVKLNQGASAFGLTVLPKAVLEDSRCPSGVQCIWAGQVRVQAQVTSAMGTGNQIFVLGTPVKTEAEVVTLTEVRPAAASGATISPEDYEFVFEIEKR